MFDKNRFSYYNNLVESYSLGIFYVYNLCHIIKRWQFSYVFNTINRYCGAFLTVRI